MLNSPEPLSFYLHARHAVISMFSDTFLKPFYRLCKSNRSVNQKGIVLVPVLLATLGIGVGAGTIMAINANTAKQTTEASQVKSIDRFVKMLEVVVADPVTCYGTVNGLPRTSPTDAATATDIQGLRFFPVPYSAGDVANRTNFVRNAAAAAEQNVSIGTHVRDESGNILTADNGKVFVTSDIQVNRLYITNLRPGTAPNTFNASLVADLSVISAPGKIFAPRVVTDLTIQVDSGTTMLGCEAVIEAKQVCESMGCRFNPNSVGKKCHCPFPDMDCNAGISPTDPRRYIIGYDTSSRTPICRDLEINCLNTKGPGFFMAGIDVNGDPICLAAEDPGTLNTTTTTTITVTTTTVAATTSTVTSTTNTTTTTTAPTSTSTSTTTSTTNSTTTTTTVPTCPAGHCCPGYPMWIGQAPGMSLLSCLEYASPPGPYIQPNSLEAIELKWTGGQTKIITATHCSGAINGITCYGSMKVTCNADGTMTYKDRICNEGAEP